MSAAATKPPLRLGRYVLFDPIASGGMATVYFGRLLGAGGFTRTVAIKRLHPHLLEDATFASVLLDEARLGGRIRHPNVVSTLDVDAVDNELFIVMDYVPGEALSRVVSAIAGDGERIPTRIAAAIVVSTLHGLHAAHETQGPRGEALNIVHRDVSPQNILIGVDGVVRVLDFGIAKAAGRLHTTRDVAIKGKVSYMAPEQLAGEPVDRRADIYAAGVVLWELLTGTRLFGSDVDSEGISRLFDRKIDPPSRRASELPKALDPVTLRALARDRNQRFDTARQMALALEKCIAIATPVEVAEWLESTCHEALARRATVVRALESDTPTDRATSEATQPTGPTTGEVTALSTPAKRPSAKRGGKLVAVAALLGLTLLAFWLGGRASSSNARGHPEVAPGIPPVAVAASPATNAGPPPESSTEPNPPAPVVSSAAAARPTPPAIRVRPQGRGRAAIKPQPAPSDFAHVYDNP